MPFGKGRRKLLWVLGFLVSGFAVLWLSLPVWFPWALRPLASKAGAHFSTYERLGYGRFSLSNLELTNHSIIVHVRRLEAVVPSVWLWKMNTLRNAGSSPFLRLDSWDCELLPSGNTNSPPLATQLQDAVNALGTARHWVPLATLSQGSVRSGKTVFTIPSATWSEGHVQARIQLPSQAFGQMIEARLTLARPFDLQIELPALRLESTVALSTNASGVDLNSTTFWQSNRFELQAHFGPNDTLPQRAALRASDFQIPGELAKLPQYKEVAGSLVADWENGRFAMDLTAAAQASASQTNLPPIGLKLHAYGDTSSATVDRLVINLPFAEATLSKTASLTFAAPFLRSAANLELNADLARQQWMPLTGRIAGTVEISPTTNTAPAAKLLVTATDVGNETLKASAVEVSARFNWPWFEVTRADARFEDGSAAALRGKIDLDKKSVSDGQFQLNGSLARRWLRPGYSYEKVSASGTFEGPFDKLAHTGRLEAAPVITPMLQPFSLTARWNGEAKSLRHFEAELSNTNSSLRMEGALTMNRQSADLQLTALSLATNHVSALQLGEPLKVEFASKSAREWQLDLSSFRWVGPGGELMAQASVQWPNQGAVRLSARNLASKLLAGFSREPLPEVSIGQLSADANWTNGPARFSLDLSGTELARPARGQHAQPSQAQTPTASASAQATSPEVAAESLLSTPLNLELELKGDEHGIVLSNLVVSSPTSEVVVARGFLPVNLTPGAPSNSVNIDSQQALVLNAAVRPEAFFWETLDQLTGLKLEEPNLNLNLSGTWKAPQGQVTFRARSIRLKQAKAERLNLQDLRLSLVLDRDKARLSEGQLLVQGQRVNISGELPMGENSWMELAHKKLPDWKLASAALRIHDAQLAAFEPLFPEILAPQGQLDLDLKLLPGQRLEGALDLRQAQTRPLGNTAPFRDINVTLRFHDRVLVLENASANLSGAPIDLNGRVDLRGTNWMGGELPPFELTLRGTNVPLAREPEYIIRSDLDLALAKTNAAAPPLVFGTAHLRDSFYLSDLADLVPGGVSKPSSRPPYFSIDNPALADWRLLVTVDGVRWLKVRTSLFNGEVSANLHLKGTLKDPLALGEVKIDSGVVRLPFGNLDLQQGLVTLSSQDPYHPRLLVRAASKQFGYDIRMEVSGAVDSPVIQFTSNPALSSEQILLMLTAGQLPQGTYTLTPQQRAQTMALFLGKDLLAKLGLSDQTQERLTIRSGEEISEQGHPTYHVEYKLTARWFVVGEYDRFGDFNGGFKWRIYSK